MRDLEKAISYIEECRDIHVRWAEWQDANPDWLELVDPSAPGDQEHHLEWVEKYNHVLEVLNEVHY